MQTTRNVLVIDSDSRNWHEVFKDAVALDGSLIRIEKVSIICTIEQVRV